MSSFQPVGLEQLGEVPGRWVVDQEIRLHQRLRLPDYPSGVDLSSSALCFPTAKLRQRRWEIDARWRRLSVGRRALLTLARSGYGRDQPLAKSHWRSVQRRRSTGV